MLHFSTPIPLDHPRLAELIDDIGCKGVPIQVKLAKALLQASMCYWNVEVKVAEQGGAMRVGWLLRMLPGAYLCAEHHAVWEMPNGQLLDVTKPGASSPGTRASLFLPEERIAIDTKTVPNIRSHYLALREDVEVAEFIQRYNKFHAATKVALGLLARLKVDPFTGEPAEGVNISKEQEQEIISAQAEVNATKERMIFARDRIFG